mgnify:CR=1 FL=1
MTEHNLKEINWNIIKKSIKISVICYVLILSSWWLVGIYSQIIFAFETQMIIAVFSGFLGFLFSKKK